MTKIVSIHSFRGGTGKSNLTANIASLMADAGYRVGIFDGDIQSPGIHIIFGMDSADIDNTLNTYLWGMCSIEEAAYKVYESAENGSIHLVPSSIKPNDIARILRERYDANDMHTAFRELISKLDLDYLLIDTHPGLNEETLLSIAISDSLIIALRPDQQDFQGTSVTVEIAHRLRVPQIHLVVNKTPSGYDLADMRRKVEDIYGCNVVALLPLSIEVAENGSAEVFCRSQPDHPFSQGVQAIAQAVLNDETVTA